MSSVENKLKNIKLAIFDIDGVFTDGKLYIDNYGNELRAFNVQDGQGIKLLIDAGLEVAIISAKDSEMVKLRMNSLGVYHLYLGYENKRIAYQALLDKLNLTPHDVVYTGDDLPDLPLIIKSACGIAVNNANSFIKENADYITKENGGNGAVREVCELILTAQGKFQHLLNEFLETM